MSQKMHHQCAMLVHTSFDVIVSHVLTTNCAQTDVPSNPSVTQCQTGTTYKVKCSCMCTAADTMLSGITKLAGLLTLSWIDAGDTVWMALRAEDALYFFKTPCCDRTGLGCLINSCHALTPPDAADTVRYCYCMVCIYITQANT